MQVECLNALVSESKPREPQENFSIPIAVRDALRPMWERIGAKNKWQAYTAAILAFHRMPQERQDSAMDEVVAARRRNDFASLLMRDAAGDEGEGQDNEDVRPPFTRRVGNPQQRPTGGKGPDSRHGARRGTRNPPQPDQSK